MHKPISDNKGTQDSKTRGTRLHPNTQEVEEEDLKFKASNIQMWEKERETETETETEKDRESKYTNPKKTDKFSASLTYQNSSNVWINRVSKEMTLSCSECTQG